ncbi:MAG TPA: amidohydrolase family protein [Geminicoccaceae bacterium]|nr:amidohydrolase family protein [Geminicoccaceae bacterium]
MQNDPFEGMRNAMNATRLVAGDPDVLPCHEALWHQTMGAARVLGLEGEIGSLEAGKRADLSVVDLDRPHLQPFYGGYPALVFYAKASDVIASVVDGWVVMEDHRLVGLDETKALAAVARHTGRWRERLRALGSRALPGACCDACGGG